MLKERKIYIDLSYEYNQEIKLISDYKGNIFDELNIEFSQKELQLLKIELFILLEKIKLYMK